MKKEIILSIKNLIIKFKTRSDVLTAIRNVSFDIYDGETLAIVGESGSGKTVLTKVFTNMLESNGWISNGTVIYLPAKHTLADKNAYFRKPIYLGDFHRVLLDNNLRKNIIRYNNKLINNEKKELEKINQLDLSLIKKEIALINEKLQILKKQLMINTSKKLTKRIHKLNEQVEILQAQERLLIDSEYKNQVLLKINQLINEHETENRRISKLSLTEKMFLSKNIKILKQYFNNKVKPDKKDLQKIKFFFDKRKYLDGIGYRVNKMNKLMIKGKKISVLLFNNLLDEWELNKNFNMINKIKVARKINHLRGPTIATIFQDPMSSLNPLLTVGFQISEVLRKHHKMSRINAKKKAVELLEKVGIPNAKKRYHDIPGMYSGGMRQRVVIAIALACQPKILICDEPTTALDVTIQAQILDLIKELQKEYQFTIIFITHDLGVVANIADRVAVMYSGQIIEYGTVDDIFFNGKHPYTWALLLSLPQFGQKGKELYSISASPPSLYNKIQGDAFAPRNKYAMKIDYLIEPPLFKVTEQHYAKTWLLDDRAPKIVKPKQLKELKNIMNDAKVGD